MIKKVITNECRVIVEPKSAGDYGFMHIGGVKRSSDQEYRLCCEIEREIKRHVDNVGWTNVEQVELYVDEDHGEYERLSDLLEAKFAEYSLDYWKVRYQHNKNGDYHSCNLYDFREVIEYAWRYPNGFEVKQLNGFDLRKDQVELIDKIVKESLINN